LSHDTKHIAINKKRRVCRDIERRSEVLPFIYDLKVFHLLKNISHLISLSLASYVIHKYVNCSKKYAWNWKTQEHLYRDTLLNLEAYYVAINLEAYRVVCVRLWFQSQGGKRRESNRGVKGMDRIVPARLCNNTQQHSERLFAQFSASYHVSLNDTMWPIERN